MAEIVLHHYPASPFSEKVRVAFGAKRLAWRSVTIPNIMPKPDLMPLTGGYRKTPVMQIGADIYCDSQIILHELERRHPQPPLLPAGHEGVARALAYWADRNIFWSAVGVVMGQIGHMLPESFQKDRTEFSGRSFDPQRLKAALPAARDQLHANLVWAEQALADGRSFLLGAAPTLADVSLYNPVWFVRARLGPDASPLDRLPALGRWAGRMAAVGTGTPSDLASSEALVIARDATPAPGIGVDPADPSGLKAGQSVTVTPDDTGRVPVTGELVGLDAAEIAVRRRDERVGEVVVHFPRAGYIVAPA